MFDRMVHGSTSDAERGLIAEKLRKLLNGKMPSDAFPSGPADDFLTGHVVTRLRQQVADKDDKIAELKRDMESLVRQSAELRVKLATLERENAKAKADAKAWAAQKVATPSVSAYQATPEAQMPLTLIQRTERVMSKYKYDEILSSVLMDKVDAITPDQQKEVKAWMLAHGWEHRHVPFWSVAYRALHLDAGERPGYRQRGYVRIR